MIGGLPVKLSLTILLSVDSHLSEPISVYIIANEEESSGNPFFSIHGLQLRGRFHEVRKIGPGDLQTP